jgi:hypothetical protein
MGNKIVSWQKKHESLSRHFGRGRAPNNFPFQYSPADAKSAGEGGKQDDKTQQQQRFWLLNLEG